MNVPEKDAVEKLDKEVEIMKLFCRGILSDIQLTASFLSFSNQCTSTVANKIRVLVYIWQSVSQLCNNYCQNTLRCLALISEPLWLCPQLKQISSGNSKRSLCPQFKEIFTAAPSEKNDIIFQLVSLVSYKRKLTGKDTAAKSCQPLSWFKILEEWQHFKYTWRIYFNFLTSL